MKKSEIAALGINIEDQIDLAGLKAAAASGNQLVHRLTDHARTGKFILGNHHSDLLHELIKAYSRLVGEPVMGSAVMRRIIEIAADQMTDLMLSADTRELHEETEAFLKASAIARR